jgi:uncharacterized BrkB/YihY/UPF0761 family membrane protein
MANTLSLHTLFRSRHLDFARRAFTIALVFGAAASLVVVLLWVYYSAQIFLFGAEFTWAYCHKFGSRKGQPMPVAPHQQASSG